MPMPASGQISFSQIQAEFGGPTPIVLSNYYRGGLYVPNASPNNAIPTSGQISLSQFYGTSKAACSGIVTIGVAGGYQGYNSPSWGSISIPGTKTVNGSTIKQICSLPGGRDLEVFLSPQTGNRALFTSVLGKTSASATFQSSGGYDAWLWGTGTAPVIPGSGTIAFAFI